MILNNLLLIGCRGEAQGRKGLTDFVPQMGGWESQGGRTGCGLGVQGNSAERMHGYSVSHDTEPPQGSLPPLWGQSPSPYIALLLGKLG